MKNIRLIVPVIICLALGFYIIGCGNPSGGGGGGGGGASTITLTGTVTGAVATTSFGQHVMIQPPQVSKVIVFNCNGGYWVANVSGGKFTVEAESGKPIGLIFANSANKFIGYLTMGSSIDSVPLNLVDSSSKEIDLNNLLIGGGVATSEYDLIGAALTGATITTSDVSAMSFANSTFANLVKHPDADGNDQVDILEDPVKYYRPFIWYSVSGGTFEGSDLTPSNIGASADINFHRFDLDIYDAGGSMPSSFIVTYPNSSTHEASYDDTNSSTRHLYNGEALTGIPANGTYEVAYNSSTLTFEVSDQANATQYIALAVPTITLTTTEGNIEKISWTYKLAGGTGDTIKPESLINDLIIQLNDTSDNNKQIYYSPNLPPSVHEHVLTETVSWDSISSMDMAYNDVFGNHIVVTWRKH